MNMNRTEQEQTLASLGGSFIADATEDGIAYPDACKVIDKFYLDAGARTALLSYRFFRSFEGFENNNVWKSGFGAEQYHFTGDEYTALMWKFQSDIARLVELSVQIPVIDKPELIIESKLAKGEMTEEEANTERERRKITEDEKSL